MLECFRCGALFESNVERRLHVKNSHYKECSVCLVRLANFAELQKHMTTFHGEQFKCDLCSKVFNTAAHLHFHITGVHKQRLVRCGFCRERFITTESMLQHVRQDHDEDGGRRRSQSPKDSREFIFLDQEPIPHMQPTSSRGHSHKTSPPTTIPEAFRHARQRFSTRGAVASDSCQRGRMASAGQPSCDSGGVTILAEAKRKRARADSDVVFVESTSKAKKAIVVDLESEQVDGWCDNVEESTQD